MPPSPTSHHSSFRHPHMYQIDMKYSGLQQGGLPMYVASCGLYSLKPPIVFVPPCIKDDVEKLMDIHRNMGNGELELDLIALDIGYICSASSMGFISICLLCRNDDLVGFVRPFKTQHAIPSQDIRQAVSKLQSKVTTKVVHLTEGFKSLHS